MKTIFIWLAVVAGVYFFAPIQSAEAAANVCFCHITPSTPFTNCTSKSGEQNGHLGHGDQPFGCECGDGVCSPEFGEDCSTCPTDCTDDTDCPLCGDGVVDEGEDCNEPGISCDTGACVGCRCLPLCGDGVVDFGEQCDGDACCNDDCTLSDTPECTGGGTGSSDAGTTDGGTTDGSDDGSADSGSGGRCEFVPQTGGNGQGCNRDFNEECAAAPNDSSLMFSFALIFLPTLALLPSLRSRRRRRS